MAIIETITDEWHFAEWCKQAKKRDSDYGHFTVEGAKALQAYFEQYSDDTGENIEFDPIAWCVEFTEYESIAEYNSDHGTDYSLGDDSSDKPDLTDETTVIEVEGTKRIIVQDF